MKRGDAVCMVAGPLVPCCHVERLDGYQHTLSYPGRRERDWKGEEDLRHNELLSLDHTQIVVEELLAK